MLMLKKTELLNRYIIHWFPDLIGFIKCIATIPKFLLPIPGKHGLLSHGNCSHGLAPLNQGLVFMGFSTQMSARPCRKNEVVSKGQATLKTYETTECGFYIYKSWKYLCLENFYKYIKKLSIKIVKILYSHKEMRLIQYPPNFKDLERKKTLLLAVSTIAKLWK